MNFKVQNISDRSLTVLVRDSDTDAELFNNRLAAGEQTPTRNAKNIFVRIHGRTLEDTIEKNIPILPPDHTDDTGSYYLVEIEAPPK